MMTWGPGPIKDRTTSRQGKCFKHLLKRKRRQIPPRILSLPCAYLSRSRHYRERMGHETRNTPLLSVGLSSSHVLYPRACLFLRHSTSPQTFHPWLIPFAGLRALWSYIRSPSSIFGKYRISDSSLNSSVGVIIMAVKAMTDQEHC